MTKLSCVYALYCIKTKKFYIGSTNNFQKRLRRHINDLNANEHHSKHLQRAWNKYGQESFISFMIEKITKLHQLVDREQYWINITNSYHNGYNTYPNAESPLGRIVSEESKKKMSLAHLGKKLREDQKIKIAEANRGSKSHFAILNEDDVKNIREELAKSEKQSELARLYNTSRTTISDIAKYKIWRHVLINKQIPKASTKGSKHWKSKLKESDIIEIKKKISLNRTLGSIGSEYGVSYATISDIKNNKTWVHI